jgi:transposase
MCEHRPRVAELEKEVAALKAELEKYRKPPKDSSNSSIPPSQDRYHKPYPKRKKSGRKSGGQLGHPGRHHPFVEEPDVIELLYPKACGHCGSAEILPLEGYGQISQEVNLPPLKPVVTEYRQYEGLCCRCGKRSRGQFPARLKAPVQMGSSISALAGYLKHLHHLSHERIAEFFQDVFQLSVSEGFVDNRLDGLAETLVPVYEAIGKALPQESNLGSDETRQRIQGKNTYLWVFQSRRFCYFVGNASRKFKVIEDIFGRKFEGVWMSDRLGSQLKIEARHQLCLAHILRNLQYAIDVEKSDWGKTLQELLRETIHFRKEQGDAFDPVNNQDIFRKCQRFRERLAALFQKPPPQPEEKKLFQSLAGWQEQLLLFLTDSAVPYDNNASERALRRPIVHRKVLGEFRSEKGAKRQDVLLSIIETAKRQGLQILDVLSGNTALQTACKWQVKNEPVRR